MTQAGDSDIGHDDLMIMVMTYSVHCVQHIDVMGVLGAAGPGLPHVENSMCFMALNYFTVNRINPKSVLYAMIRGRGWSDFTQYISINWYL